MSETARRLRKASYVTLKEATAHDSAILSQLARETFTETFGHLYSAADLNAHLDSACTQQFFVQALRKKDCVALIAYDEKRAVGYALWENLSLPINDAPKGSMQLQRLYVKAPYHGKAIGAALIEEMLLRLEECPMIYLGVWENNVRAQKFYARYGFSYIDEHVFLVGEHPDRDLIYARERVRDSMIR